ncbi:MAG: glycerate kinase [Clostridia bacterium]
MKDHASLRADAETIFRAGVLRVDPRPMVREAVRLEGSILTIQADGRSQTWDLANYDRLMVLGFGKASARMALGLEDALGNRIRGGLIAVKHGHGEILGFMELIEASHPVPDESSAQAARRILALAKEADERTLVIILVSGGGSAILCAPWGDAPWDDGRRRISLKDKAAVTSALLACGADIREINTVRRHLSAVKGGRLAAALFPATVVSLVLSDVLGDELSSIASGPTVPDATYWADAMGVVQRYNIESRIPEAAMQLLRDGLAGEVPDTPKPGDPLFNKVSNIILGSNRQAALAAVAKAEELGYRTVYLGSRVACEAREAALFYQGIAASSASHGEPAVPPACIIGGGETTVTIRGEGKGGRNQEMALAFLCGLIDMEPGLAERLCFLSGGTDGNDGPTDAAGAFADAALLASSRKAGLDPRKFLASNDSYHYFEHIHGLLKTGPTNTNVCDLQVALIV